jgi:ABC-type nitrate/sulfonate/bicarbonate transport system permease component
MNSEYEKRLEAEIDRQLKALPELAAPSGLMSQVMARIEQRAVQPWYRRSWQTWPVTLQGFSLVALLALFGGICFGGWELARAASFSSAAETLRGWLSGLSLIWNVATTLANAAALALKQLGTGFLIGCLLALALGYAACVGLGTVYVRLAMARR